MLSQATLYTTDHFSLWNSGHSCFRWYFHILYFLWDHRQGDLWDHIQGHMYWLRAGGLNTDREHKGRKTGGNIVSSGKYILRVYTCIHVYIGLCFYFSTLLLFNFFDSSTYLHCYFSTFQLVYFATFQLLYFVSFLLFFFSLFLL